MEGQLAKFPYNGLYFLRTQFRLYFHTPTFTLGILVNVFNLDEWAFKGSNS